MASPSSTETLTATVTVEKLVYGGDGLIRWPDGRVVFMEGGAPGDTVQATYTPPASKSATAKAKLVSIQTPGPGRVEPKCPITKECGGCQWQHLSASAQAESKQAIVKESLERLGKFESVPVLPIISTEPWQYRHTVRWGVAEQNGQYVLGYHQEHSNTIVTFTQCAVLPDAMVTVAELLVSSLQPVLALCSEVHVRSNHAGELLLGFVTHQLSLSKDATVFLQENAESLVEKIPQIKGFLSMPPKSVEPSLLWGREILVEQYGDADYMISLGHFLQSHKDGANTLIDVVGSLLPEYGESLLDLYGGSGLFGVAFAERFDRISGVEGHAWASRLAQETLMGLELMNAQWLTLSVEDYVNSAGESESATVTLLDPPRNGVKPFVLDWVAAHTADTIIYVSCNPTTLARDARRLVDAGWQIKTVQPVDLFPQTYHIETVMAFTR